MSGSPLQKTETKKKKKKKKKIAKHTGKQFCQSFFLNKVATLFQRDSGTCKTAKLKKKIFKNTYEQTA